MACGARMCLPPSEFCLSTAFVLRASAAVSACSPCDLCCGYQPQTPFGGKPQTPLGGKSATAAHNKKAVVLAHACIFFWFARAYAIMAMVYAWLDKEDQFAKHLALAKQLIQLMDDNPEREEEVPMVGALVLSRYKMVAPTQAPRFSCSARRFFFCSGRAGWSNGRRVGQPSSMI